MKTKDGQIVEATMPELAEQYAAGGWEKILTFRQYVALLRYDGVKIIQEEASA